MNDVPVKAPQHPGPGKIKFLKRSMTFTHTPKNMDGRNVGISQTRARGRSVVFHLHLCLDRPPSAVIAFCGCFHRLFSMFASWKENTSTQKPWCDSKGCKGTSFRIRTVPRKVIHQSAIPAPAKAHFSKLSSIFPICNFKRSMCLGLIADPSSLDSVQTAGIEPSTCEVSQVAMRAKRSTLERTANAILIWQHIVFPEIRK